MIKTTSNERCQAAQNGDCLNKSVIGFKQYFRHESTNDYEISKYYYYYH